MSTDEKVPLLTAKMAAYCHTNMSKVMGVIAQKALHAIGDGRAIVTTPAAIEAIKAEARKQAFEEPAEAELHELRRLLKLALKFVSTNPDLTQPGGDELREEMQSYLTTAPERCE